MMGSQRLFSQLTPTGVRHFVLYIAREWRNAIMYGFDATERGCSLLQRTLTYCVTFLKLDNHLRASYFTAVV